MAKREVKSWITINGVHVPIFEGQTKEEAAKAAIERQKKRGPVSSDTRKKAVGDYVDKKRQYRDAYDKTEVFQRHHDRASNAEEREVANIKLKSAARDRDSKLQEFAKASDKVANLNKQKVRQSAEFKPKNTFENRKKLKDQIDAYVKAHPNPNAEDRNKVSAMRDRYNAMVKESAAKTKAKVNAELAEERKRDAQKKELEDLKREHYKLYKHDEDNIPDRDEKLNALEKKINALENGSDSTSGKKQSKKDVGKGKGISEFADYAKTDEHAQYLLDRVEEAKSDGYSEGKSAAEWAKELKDQYGYDYNTGSKSPSKPAAASKGSTPEFKNRQEAEEYYKNKFAGVSSTYANKMAKKMGIEGRGKDKREALAKAYADRWETSNNINKDQDLKEKQIAANAAEKKQAEKAFARGEISPEQMKGYGFTDKELEKIKKAGREEALQRVAEGKNTTQYIDPMGNINQTKTRSLYEKNYGEDFRDMSKPNARLEIAKMNDDGKTNHNIIEGKDITKLSDEEVHQLQVNQWRYKLTPLQKDALDKEMKSRGYYFEQGGWHKNSNGKTKVGETSGGTFNYKEMQAKLDRERVEKAAKEKALSDEANRTFKPASNDIKRMAQAETLKSLGINRDAAINEIRNRTGLSLEDAERKMSTMSVDQIKKLAGSNTGNKTSSMSKEEAMLNYKAIKISKNMPIAKQEELKRLKAQYLKIWKG